MSNDIGSFVVLIVPDTKIISEKDCHPYELFPKYLMCNFHDFVLIISGNVRLLQCLTDSNLYQTWRGAWSVVFLARKKSRDYHIQAVSKI